MLAFLGNGRFKYFAQAMPVSVKLWYNYLMATERTYPKKLYGVMDFLRTLDRQALHEGRRSAQKLR